MEATRAEAHRRGRQQHVALPYHRGLLPELLRADRAAVHKYVAYQAAARDVASQDFELRASARPAQSSLSITYTVLNARAECGACTAAGAT
jgi:hypothetical protein